MGLTTLSFRARFLREESRSPRTAPEKLSASTQIPPSLRSFGMTKGGGRVFPVIFLLTLQICNLIVTHYASPIGYIFQRGCLPGFGGSNTKKSARSAAAGAATGWANR